MAEYGTKEHAIQTLAGGNQAERARLNNAIVKTINTLGNWDPYELAQVLIDLAIGLGKKMGGTELELLAVFLLRTCQREEQTNDPVDLETVACDVVRKVLAKSNLEIEKLADGEA